MADNERLICAAAELEERARGVRFALPELGEQTVGFVVRHDGVPYAYVNRCAHVPVELDWMEGEFFDAEGNYLICATHGAHYAPQTGYCVMGPCAGASLQPLTVVERDGNIYLKMDD